MKFKATYLLQTTAKNYYKLLQKIITNYDSSYFCKIQNYYKLRQVLLHITTTFSVITITANFITNTAGITNCDVITYYVITLPFILVE